MMNLISNLWDKVVYGIGAAFVSVGMAISGGGQVAEIPIVVEEEMSVEESSRNVDSEDVTAPSKAVVSADPISAPVIERKDESVQNEASENGVFKISDIRIHTENDGRAATFNWNTTKPARSRIEVDGDTYDSSNGLSTDHKVRVTGLNPNERYNYSISARTQDNPQLEDDVNGSHFPFKDGKTHTVILQDSDDNDCQNFLVIDSTGKSAAGITLSIIAMTNTDTGVSISSATKKLTSNNRGLVELCGFSNNNGSFFRIQSKETGTINL